MDFERIAAEVLQDHTDLAAIAGVDGCGAVRERDRMLQGEAAAGTDLRFETGRQFDTEAGRDQLCFARRERCRFDCVQIHAGVFSRAVGIAGNDGVFPEFADF